MLPIRKPFWVSGRFKNAENERPSGFFLKTLTQWMRTSFGSSLSANTRNEWFATHPPLSSAARLAITWIGHSTFLIQTNGINILTDPIFFNISTGFKRNMPPGITIESLPPIDVVLISHNHWDHMHGPTLKKLRPGITQREGMVLVPQGDERWFMNNKFNRVAAHTWGEQQTITTQHGRQPITVTFLPAWHWSRRSLFDRNKSLWGSWMIETGEHTVYFAGDTAYADHFTEIQRAFPSIDIALMPIGPGEPREHMKHSHVDAYEAAQAFVDLQAGCFIPMHWGTFNFGLDTLLLPVDKLTAWWHEAKLPEEKKLQILKIGQRIVF